MHSFIKLPDGTYFNINDVYTIGPMEGASDLCQVVMSHGKQFRFNVNPDEFMKLIKDANKQRACEIAKAFATFVGEPIASAIANA